jgi:hypothetical protein
MDYKNLYYYAFAEHGSGIDIVCIICDSLCLLPRGVYINLGNYHNNKCPLMQIIDLKIHTLIAPPYNRKWSRQQRNRKIIPIL